MGASSMEDSSTAASRRYCCDDCDYGALTAYLISCVVAFFILLWMSFNKIRSSPKPPEFQLQAVETTTPFALTNPETTLNGGLNMTFWIQNPYRGAIYNKATLEVYYYRSLLLSSSTPFDTLCPVTFSCKDMPQSWLPVTIDVSSISVSDPVTAVAIMSDLRRQELSLDVKIVADFRVSKYPDTAEELRVSCDDVKIGVPTGVMIGGPKDCEVYWSKDLRTKHYWLSYVGASFLLSFIGGPILCCFLFLLLMSSALSCRSGCHY